MSELSLTFFMLLGYAQAHWFVLLIFLAGSAILTYLAWHQKGSFFQPALIKQAGKGLAGLFVFLLLTLPWMTGSSLTMLGYWVDWVLLLVMAFGYAVAGLLWIYPAVRLYAGLKPEESK